ncbi:MAG: transposase [Chloroflexota bacterium]
MNNNTLPNGYNDLSMKVGQVHFPKANTERQALATQVGTDGFALLVAIDTPDTPAIVRAEPAVEVLRRVWIQQYYGPDDGPRWRSTADAPPPDDLIHSPYDLDARYSSKRGMRWTGYKVHMTETCDTTAPHIITHVETTPATRPDDHMVDVIHAALEHKHLLPAEHLVDGGYTDATTLIASPQRCGVTIVGRVAADPSWQAREQTGYAQAAFQIDWNAQKATCPQGKQSRKWFKDIDVNGQDVVQIRFSQKECNQCPVRAACTRAKTQPRTITIRTQPQYDALQRARQQQDTPAFQALYAARGGVEEPYRKAPAPLVYGVHDIVVWRRPIYSIF